MLETLSHFLLPKDSNNHRAKILHHPSLLLLVLFFFVTPFFFQVTERHTQGVLGISYSITPEELLFFTNVKRQENGLPVLQMDSQLAQAAAQKANHMFAHNYWAHVAPDGTTPWYFIKGSGYEYVYAGENLARGYTTANDVVNAWMASPSHRENMLSGNYTEIGFAIVPGTLTGDETVLVVEMFGSRTRSVAQSSVVPDQPAPTPSPTVAPVRQVARIAFPTATPTLTPTPIITSTPTPFVTQPPVRVAAIQNEPLINKPVLQRNIALAVVIGLLVIFILDILLIQRRNIVRLLSHNLDHIIFFGMLLIVIILVTSGAVL